MMTPIEERDAAHHISELTRRDILDRISLDGVPWWGRRTEVEFLSRLYDLKALPSTDYRYADAAGDIHQHRVNNYDWNDDWVFHDPRFAVADGPDESFLAFLAEMLHPAVVRNAEEAAEILAWLNELLRPDGFELVAISNITGRPIYGGQRREAFHGSRPDLKLQTVPVLTDPIVLHEHLDRIDNAIGRDPAGAIGSSKELLESLCKVILDGSAVPYGRKDDLPKLYRAVADLLALRKESVPESARGSESAHKILAAMVTTLFGLAELRNELGSGHGRSGPNPALERHARLALNAAVTVGEFLLATWAERDAAGTLPRLPT